MASKRSGARKVNFSNSKAELIHFSFDKRYVTSNNKMNVSLDIYQQENSRIASNIKYIVLR